MITFAIVMPDKDFKELNEKIVHGLQVAETEMLVAKAKNDEDVIVSNGNGEICSVPAKNFF